MYEYDLILFLFVFFISQNVQKLYCSDFSENLKTGTSTIKLDSCQAYCKNN